MSTEHAGDAIPFVLSARSHMTYNQAFESASPHHVAALVIGAGLTHYDHAGKARIAATLASRNGETAQVWLRSGKVWEFAPGQEPVIRRHDR